ncbi:hypothetical protein [Herbidospora yilanensis]|uniref:hypothetical protein n=1 Tax=Herbidospora yilanensis TaxID=354426 RepID=UPI000785F734|nr:hypothetical protein [Herbidospora yilanensis]
MTYGSNLPNLPVLRVELDFGRDDAFAGVQWICLVCDGAEECEPGDEAPTPAICPSCNALAVAEAMNTLRESGVSADFSGIEG